MVAAAPEEAPLHFLQLVADPLRWQLLGELARSDRRVGEVAERLGKAQNLVSYHLGELRAGGLVVRGRALPMAATPTTGCTSHAWASSS